jgi:hypothetical protein
MARSKKSSKKKSAKRPSIATRDWLEKVKIFRRRTYLIMMDLDYDATDAEIIQRYNHLKRQLYPNREGKDKEAFQRLQMAYDYLMKKDTNLAIKSRERMTNH